jgi:hypothetical protein
LQPMEKRGLWKWEHNVSEFVRRDKMSSWVAFLRHV